MESMEPFDISIWFYSPIDSVGGHRLSSPSGRDSEFLCYGRTHRVFIESEWIRCLFTTSSHSLYCPDAQSRRRIPRYSDLGHLFLKYVALKLLKIPNHRDFTRKLSVYFVGIRSEPTLAPSRLHSSSHHLCAEIPSPKIGCFKPIGFLSRSPWSYQLDRCLHVLQSEWTDTSSFILHQNTKSEQQWIREFSLRIGS